MAEKSTDEKIGDVYRNDLNPLKDRVNKLEERINRVGREARIAAQVAALDLPKQAYKNHKYRADLARRVAGNVISQVEAFGGDDLQASEKDWLHRLVEDLIQARCSPQSLMREKK